MGGWNLLGGLMPPAVDTAGESEQRHSGDSGTEEEFEILGREEIKERRYSGDSGNESQEEANVRDSDVEPSVPITLQFQLTQSLLSQVKASENDRNANSGKQAYTDLPRMDFVINGQVIDKNFVSQLRDKCNQNDQRQIAKHVFTKMFEHAKAEILNDNLLEELITSCNQAGYDGSLLMQLSPIFLGHDLQLPDANDRHIEIVCSDQDSLNVKYCPNMPVKQLGKEICRVDAILEFTLKFRDSKVEYENGKVTLAIPEQLENYKADGKSLLDEINRHFEDADNAIVESLVKNIGEGPKSFVLDLQAKVDSDSFYVIPKNAVFDLGHIPELIKKAVDDKDVNALANHIGFFQGHVTHIPPKEGLPVVEKTLEIVSGFIEEQGEAWNCHPTVPIASHIYSAKQQYYDGYISQEDYEKLKKLEETLYEIKSDLIKRSSNDPNEESPVKNAQDTSAILNETPTSSQAVNREDNNQLNTKESKNQRPQRSIVDKGENIMNNKKASIEETIDNNNYRRGKMHSSDQNIKTVGEMLFDAISSFDCKKVRSLVEQAKQEGNNVASIMNEAFKKANETRVKQQSTASRKKLKKIKEFLKKELDNIAILSMSNDVETTVSRQEVPVLELERSESDLASSSSEDDDFSKLESDDSARTSSDSSLFDIIPETAVPKTAAEMPSMVTEEKSDDLNDEKDDQQNLTIPTAVDQGTSPIPESQCGTAHNEEDFTVPSQSSSLGFANESVNTIISIDNNREEQTSNKPAEYVEQVANGNGQPKTVANKQVSNSNEIYTKENSVKWPTIATWMFAITGMLAVAAASAAYFALGTSLLLAGVAAGIGAFCIVAAIAVHYYNKAPSGPLKGPDVEEVIRNAAVGTS